MTDIVLWRYKLYTLNKRRRKVDVGQLRIDFAVASRKCGWMLEEGNCMMLNHASVGGSLLTSNLLRTTDREVAAPCTHSLIPLLCFTDNYFHWTNF